MVPTLLQEGFGVTVLDSFFFGQNSLMDCCSHDRLRVIRGDVRNELVLKEALASQDIIIPLAATVGASLCNLDESGAVFTIRPILD